MILRDACSPAEMFECVPEAVEGWRIGLNAALRQVAHHPGIPCRVLIAYVGAAVNVRKKPPGIPRQWAAFHSTLEVIADTQPDKLGVYWDFAIVLRLALQFLPIAGRCLKRNTDAPSTLCIPLVRSDTISFSRAPVYSAINSAQNAVSPLPPIDGARQ